MDSFEHCVYTGMYCLTTSLVGSRYKIDAGYNGYMVYLPCCTYDIDGQTGDYILYQGNFAHFWRLWQFWVFLSASLTYSLFLS